MVVSSLLDTLKPCNILLTSRYEDSMNIRSTCVPPAWKKEKTGFFEKEVQRAPVLGKWPVVVIATCSAMSEICTPTRKRERTGVKLPIRMQPLLTILIQKIE
jgi:hypothetical protein